MATTKKTPPKKKRPTAAKAKTNRAPVAVTAQAAWSAQTTAALVWIFMLLSIVFLCVVVTRYA